MVNAQILVVEDDGIVALGLRTRLQSLGYQVLEMVPYGEDAVKKAAEIKPDLVLMDIRLKGKIDGIEAARQIRECSNIPVIYLTAYADDQTLERAKLTEPYGYILKPIEERDLHTTIEMALYKHEMEQKLQKYMVELQARNEELDAFAHTVAHDLKNLVGRIVGLADSSHKHYDRLSDRERKEDLEAIIRSGQKIAHIIDDLLLLAGVRVKKIALQPLDMASILAEAQQRLAQAIEAYQVELILPNTWPAALGYGPWIEEVWFNYLSNGISYGGRPPRLEVGAEPQPGGMVRFWVHDNGTGLTPEEQAHLFIPFTRLKPEQSAGHGLGLSIVRRIVQKLQGEVGVQSQGPGQGSTFSFTLPAVTAQEIGTAQ